MLSSKDRILDAAERVVLRLGGGHLTIDAVAHEAELSKGGVLYNFPTKDDLVRGMLVRLTQHFDADMTARAEADLCPAGRATRAYIDACFPTHAPLSAPCDPIAAGLLAAVATNPALLDPLREATMANHARFTHDGIDPVLAIIIHLAIDGLWMADLFGVNSLDPNMRKQVIERLRSLTKEPQ